MGKKLFTLLLSLVVCSTFAQTRPGSLKGQIKDAKTGETIPFVNVVVKDNSGAIVTGGTADIDGNYNINPINPGTYNVEISLSGYAKITLREVKIQPNSPTLKDFKMSEATQQLEEVVLKYEKPLIDKAKTSTVTDAEDIVNMAARGTGAIAAQVAGATQDANGNINIRGARGEGTVYFIDGVKVRGSVNLPQAAIQQQEVITGGLPAQYGDALGGIVSTTTRGPSGEYFGNAEVVTSTLFDNYNYNLAAFTYGGPLWKNKKDQPIVGFLLSTEFQYNEEPRPTSVPYIEVDESYLTDLENRPLEINPSGQSVFYRSEFTTEDNLTDADARKNSWSNQLRLTGNIQIKTSRTTNLTFGGRWIYSNDKAASYGNHIFNYKTNLDALSSDWSAFGRFQQQFTSDKNSNSLIKNAFYNIQVDYSRNIRETTDGRYGRDFFKYGHVGAFDVQTTPAYVFGTDSATGVQGFRFVGDAPIGIGFEQGPNNTVRGNYTSQYFDLVQDFPALTPFTIEQLIGNAIPVNGTGPRSVYGLWGSPGAIQGNYSKTQNSQFRVTASTNFDIKDHSLIVGIEYEQRSDRAYSLAASGLWTQMRLLQNRPNQQLDLANPILVRDANGVYQDTIRYNYLYSPTDASRFSENVRRANGLDPFGTDQINILAMDPSLFSLDFFSADELVNPGGAQFVNYYGFDYTGEVLSTQPTISEFFTARDSRGDLSRPVGAFQPIYIAGYIQDQFTFRDLTFNVGVRVDRFDLNQEVLQDPFVLFPTHRVRDLASTELSSEAIADVPSTIGGDYVVYVSSFDYGSASIVGYRNPENNQWFDANGDPLIDPQDLSDAAGGGIKPLLVTPPTQSADANSTLTSESFKDYEPQTVVMPRISFNFPITDEALFIAHYDVLAQRPTTGISRLNPFSYLNLLNNDNAGILNNPDLRPQKTTEYELGFKQALTDKSALKISAFYRELRDLLQTTAFAQAYPITYVAYGNLDFGTIKGFSLEYELRRTNNFKLDANYTLQFADGTGSGTTSGLALANAGQPNLRYILPLSYDRRHQMTVRMDYRYGRGARYNGPVWWNTRVLETFGVNVVMNALSGAPYTKRVDFRSNAQIDGQINGARLPWQITFDARINKMFPLKNSRKSIEVYVQILNLFDTQNITSVYAFTGSPSDDGFLSSAAAAAQITQQANAQSYVDLYNRSVNSPFNYALPRRMRLGIMYNF